MTFETHFWEIGDDDDGLGEAFNVRLAKLVDRHVADALREYWGQVQAGLVLKDGLVTVEVYPSGGEEEDDGTVRYFPLREIEGVLDARYSGAEKAIGAAEELERLAADARESAKAWTAGGGKG